MRASRGRCLAKTVRSADDPAMARPRRRRRAWSAAVIAAALLVWLGVRSADGPAPQSGPSEPQRVDATLVGTTRSEPRDDEAPVPGGEHDARAALRDRFAGCLRAMGSDDFASAWRARRDAEGLALIDDERAELERVAGALAARTCGEIERAFGLAAAGEVLVAARTLAAMRDAGGAELLALLDAASKARGIAWPASRNPDPLPRGIAVRWFDPDGSERRGEVVDARGEELRVRTRGEQGGFVFPTIARVAVEPLVPQKALALDAARVAQAAGDELLALLFCVRAAALRD